MIALSASSAGGRPSPCHSPIVRPVASSTSSARRMRERSRTISRAAVFGSTRASSACSASTPSVSSRAFATRADVGIDRRNAGDAGQQRLEIEPGAADEDRCLAGGRGLREHVLRVAKPVPDRMVHGRVDMAVKPVRRALFFLRRRARGDDAQVAIDLHGIGVDHDAAKLSRRAQGQRGLAARGRPCNKQRAPAACLEKPLMTRLS